MKTLKTRVAPIFALTLLAMTAAGCPWGGQPDPEPDPQEPFLEPPSKEQVEAVQSIRQTHPGAVIQMSQRHGYPLAITAGPAQYPVQESDQNRIQPLAAAQGAGASERAATLLSFFRANGAIFGIQDADRDLKAPVDPVNGELGGFGKGQSNDPMPLQAELVQLHQGIRIEGRYATGLFDPAGNLHSVLTRLLPVASGLDSTADFAPEELTDLIAASVEDAIQEDGSLHWLRQVRDFAKAPRSVELVWFPRGAKTDSTLTLAYRVQLRGGPNEALFFIDAQTGERIRSYNTMPSEWVQDGTSVRAAATDELGNLESVLATREGDWMYMGINGNHLSNRYFSPGHFIAVSNSAGRTNPDWIWYDPMRENRTLNIWTLTGAMYAATDLMRNLESTLEWWRIRGWKSYDGRGTAMWAAINGNKTEDPSTTRDLNAWGGGGNMMFGDAQTATGQYTGSSLEIVGHEFMHNVVGATSRLAYYGESGAVNEALADFFGVALTASGDDYGSDQIGDDIGWGIRNMVDPGRQGQPETYAQFVQTRGDSGGVHTNSGIANKAHSLLVRGGTFRGFTVPRIGVARTEEILRHANQLRAFRPEASMEEFAAGVVAFCDLTRVMMELLGGSRLAERTETCGAFRQAYSAVQLLPGTLDNDLAVERVQLDRSGMKVWVRNVSGARISPFNFRFEIMDELGETAIEEVVAGTFRDERGWAVSVFEPGMAAIATLSDFGASWAGPGARTTTREHRVSFAPLPGLPNQDVNMANNVVRFHHGSDYVSAVNRMDPPSQYNPNYRIVPFPQNLSDGMGAPAGLKVAFLVREGTSGPLVPLTGFSGSESVLPADASSSGSFYGMTELTAAPIANTPSPFPATIMVTSYSPTQWTYPYGTGRVPYMQTWMRQDGSLPGFEGTRQLYALVDPENELEEMDERNNLVCVNCRYEGQPPLLIGVMVRIPAGTDVDALFPAQYREGARALLGSADMPRLALPVSVPALPYRFEAASPLGLTLDY